MSSVSELRLGWTDLVTNSTTDSFHPSTVWMPFARGGLLPTGVRAQMEMRGKWASGGAVVSICPGYQTCNDEKNPDNAVTGVPILIENPSGTPAGYGNADGFYEFASGGPTSLALGGKEKIRFGWVIKVSTNFGGARVRAPILDLVY